MIFQERTTYAARMRRLTMAVLLGLAAAAACSGDGPTGNIPADEVRVRDNSFSPATRTVAAGTTVTFRWTGSAQHNVTFDDGPASANQASGTYQRTFPNAGDYPYECTIHGASMSGTIVVQ